MNSYNYTNLMTELENKRTKLIQNMLLPSVEDKKILLKEVNKLNGLLKCLSEYKMDYMDEQPLKEMKEVKEPKVKKVKKELEKISGYGIRSMIN